ncbi:hypothetical protein DENIS_3086 [Desulfonema ishimotonii]|uniref:Uncharacterized protein n=1 Tax=Desulfonema ishimotonii TaxID=45657 RepID=A0A401FYU8_9BACT|nr:hypothetical protein [Desulfonema ishimotonii]GBC62123.1 hypothetical protein DENIS_3086 [Desulfonema ishimotonii]
MVRLATGTSACYDYGYKWGVCTIMNTADGSCDPVTDTPIPGECRSRADTQQGIKDGLRATQMRLQRGE